MELVRCIDVIIGPRRHRQATIVENLPFFVNVPIIVTSNHVTEGYGF